jgi:hypothetical protein
LHFHDFDPHFLECDPSTQIEVFSLQQRSVIDKVARGEMHRQDWRDCAAFDDGKTEWFRRTHRRAYLWLTAQFASKIGWRPRNALVWVAFCYRCIIDYYKLDAQSQAIVRLRVPRSELLVLDQPSWEKRVLSDDTYFEHEGSGPVQTFRPSYRERRRNWNKVFSLGEKPEDWQAVVDRIEPDWFLGVIEPVPSSF